jgi:ribosomal protein S6
MSITEDHNGDSQVYEVGYLVLPSIPEDDLPKVVDSIKNVITQNGGTPLDSEEPVLRDLAYSLTKVVGASRYVVRDAYFGWMKFESEPSNTPAIKVGLDAVNELVRFLLIKAPRESDFTFAKAREARAQAEAEVIERREEAELAASEAAKPVDVAPVEPVIE